MRKRRILVVEDQAIYREPIAATLDAHGYKTVCAENGAVAIEEMKRNQLPFELILLDVSMPKMDGISFLEKIRAFPDWGQIPVVMLTEVAERDLVLKARALGVEDDVLKATFSLDDLLRCVDKHLSR